MVSSGTLVRFRLMLYFGGRIFLYNVVASVLALFGIGYLGTVGASRSTVPGDIGLFFGIRFIQILLTLGFAFGVLMFHRFRRKEYLLFVNYGLGTGARLAAAWLLHLSVSIPAVTILLIFRGSAQ